jgi:hypothetical protein
MGVGIYEIRHEYWQMLILMGFYFCTAAVALYVSAVHNAKRVSSCRQLKQTAKDNTLNSINSSSK